MILGAGFQAEMLDLGDRVLVHPTAQIAPGVELGPGTIVWAGANILAGTRIGPHASIGAHTEVGRDCVFGESVRIGYGCFIPNRTKLGDRVFIGPNATLTDDRHPRVNNPTYRAEPPTLESDVNVGAGAVLLPGITVGRGATIGAGAVVTKSVMPHCTVVGVPAHPLRTHHYIG